MIQRGSAKRIADGGLGGHPFTMNVAMKPGTFPIQAHIRTDPAVIDASERGTQGYSTPQDQFVSDNLAQKAHGFAHALTPRFVGMMAHAGGIQEIQFDQVVAPHVEDGVKDFR